MLSGELRYKERRNLRGIGEGLVEHLWQSRHDSQSVRAGQDQFRVIGAQMTGNSARVSCLDWTSSDGSQTGSSALNAGTQVNTEMSDFYGFSCSVPRRLYCFQQ